MIKVSGKYITVIHSSPHRWEWSAGDWVVAARFQESMQMSKGKKGHFGHWS